MWIVFLLFSTFFSFSWWILFYIFSLEFFSNFVWCMCWKFKLFLMNVASHIHSATSCLWSILWCFVKCIYLILFHQMLFYPKYLFVQQWLPAIKNELEKKMFFFCLIQRSISDILASSHNWQTIWVFLLKVQNHTNANSIQIFLHFLSFYHEQCWFQ